MHNISSHQHNNGFSEPPCATASSEIYFYVIANCNIQMYASWSYHWLQNTHKIYQKTQPYHRHIQVMLIDSIARNRKNTFVGVGNSTSIAQLRFRCLRIELIYMINRHFHGKGMPLC